MRKILLCILMILGFEIADVSARQSPQATFDEAGELLDEGEIREAFSRYKSIEKNGWASGPLFLNLGITAMQLDSMGLAKYYFLKAERFEDTNEEAGVALEYVNRQFSRKSAMLPKLPWDRAVEWMINGPGVMMIFVVGFCITMVGLMLLYLKWFGTFHHSKSSTVITTLLIAGTVVALSAFYADYVDRRYDEAIYINAQSKVYESPNEQATLVSMAYEGYRLTVDHYKSEEKDGWYYIRLGNGQYGWIASKGVKVL